MADFVVARVEKIKSVGTLAAAVDHLNRDRDTLNADPERKKENIIKGGHKDEVLGHFRQNLAQLDKAPRSNSVLALEYVFSYSHQAPDMKSKVAQEFYFSDCKKYLTDRFGEKNVLISAIHRDELTPHMHVIVMPVIQRRNAQTNKLEKALVGKAFTGGPGALRQLQTEIGKIGERHGLERGVEGSKAIHQSLRRFYAKLDRHPAIDRLVVPEKGLFEKPEVYSERVRESLTKQIGKDYHKAVELYENEKGRANRLEKEIGPRPKKEDIAYLQRQNEKWMTLNFIASASMEKLNSWIREVREEWARESEISQARSRQPSRGHDKGEELGR